MIILAIDPATRCGWAVRQSDGTYTSGVWDLAPPRGSSPGVRYLYLRARLAEVRTAFPSIGLVVVEQAHHRGGAATEYAHGVSTHVQSWCAENGVEHSRMHGSKAKRVATGRGNADKAAMVRAAEVRWPGYTFATDDEADARWIAEAAAQEYGVAAPASETST